MPISGPRKFAVVRLVFGVHGDPERFESTDAGWRLIALYGEKMFLRVMFACAMLAEHRLGIDGQQAVA